MKYNTEVFVQFENIELKFQYLIFLSHLIKILTRTNVRDYLQCSEVRNKHDQCL